MGKLSLYWNTVKYLKPGQIWFRARKMLKIKCTLGVSASGSKEHGEPVTIPQLDFDAAFLRRFPVKDLMEDRIVLLHEAEKFDWNTPWRFDNRSALWNYNLHYFEFLFPLVKAWRDTGETCYLDKIKTIILGWISQNPRENGGAGWDPYPISLRLINWLSCFGYLAPSLDEEFRQRMLASMEQQYVHLSEHLEKHLLGNHYFENLKTLVICGVFFRDGKTVEAALRELKVQCREQILDDGMHFELSPMYHKLILEDMLRVSQTLRQAGHADAELEGYLQKMTDAAYSLEEGLDRIPLFNDCGDNVAKSLDAILLTARELFGIEPKFQSQLPTSGYYIFKTGQWKLIVDAGQPGPRYLPGHAHCDAMSFELFRAGKPVLVNCGTYAYQCKDRLFFKNTAAHNTVMRKGVEQSQCWGSFRMAKRAMTVVLQAGEHFLAMEMRDQKNGLIQRSFKINENEIVIHERCAKEQLRAFYHCNTSVQNIGNGCWELSQYARLSFLPHQTVSCQSMPHAPEYGQFDVIPVLVADAVSELECTIGLQ